MLRVDPVSNGITFTNGHKVEIGHAHEGGRGAEITMGFGKIKVFFFVYLKLSHTVSNSRSRLV